MEVYVETMNIGTTSKQLLLQSFSPSSVHKYSTIILISAGLNVRKLKCTYDELATRLDHDRAMSLASIGAGKDKTPTVYPSNPTLAFILRAPW